MLDCANRRPVGLRLVPTALSFLAAFTLIFTLAGGTSASVLDPPRVEVRFSSSESDRTLGVGTRLGGNWWALVNLDHLGSADGPEASVAAVYRVPKKFFVFDIYGGLGARVTDDPSGVTTHVTAGASFWFLFWENEYRLDSTGEALRRSGFRVTF